MSVQKKLRFGQAKDPKVIDEELINAELIASGEKLNYTEVRTLSLSDKRPLSRDIMEIQNLDGLDNLEKLQLDNNIINSIQGLDHLTKLKWLDLSFNCISEIKGLSKLVNLTDLTLSNNRIVVVDGLKDLRELVFLSLNNNLIANLGQLILGVRPLKTLKVLNCSGNPFQKDQPNYQEYIVFHLKESLKYVDSIYIDETMKSAAHQEDKYKLEELEDRTDEANKKREDINVKDYESLNVMILYQYDMNLLKESKEMMHILTIASKFENSRNNFKESIRGICGGFISKLSSTQQSRVAMQRDFDRIIQKIDTEAEKTTLSLIAEYFKKKERVKLAWEDEEHDWVDQVNDILHFIDTELDRKLMLVEADRDKDTRTIFEKHQNGQQNSSIPNAQNSINNSYSVIDGYLGTEVLVQAEAAIGIFIDQFKEEAKEHHEEYTNYKEMLDKLGGFGLGL